MRLEEVTALMKSLSNYKNNIKHIKEQNEEKVLGAIQTYINEHGIDQIDMRDGGSSGHPMLARALFYGYKKASAFLIMLGAQVEIVLRRPASVWPDSLGRSFIYETLVQAERMIPPLSILSTSRNRAQAKLLLLEVEQYNHKMIERVCTINHELMHFEQLIPPISNLVVTYLFDMSVINAAKQKKQGEQHANTCSKTTPLSCG